MEQEFTVAYLVNEELDSTVALNLTFEGSGSALVLGSSLINYTQGIVAGLVFVVVGVLFLLFHLGNRFRCWRVIVGLKNSWISRGALFAGGLILFGALCLYPMGGSYEYAVRAGAILFAFLTIIYSGFLLTSMTPIPFWNTPLIPVLFLLHSGMTGISILMFMLGVSTGGALFNNGLMGWAVLLGVMTLIFTIIYPMVMATSTNAARESVRLLLVNGLRISFIGGAITAGLIVPLVIFLYLNFGGTGLSAQNLIVILAVSMVFRAVGDYTFRSSVLKAGVFEMMI